MQDENLQQEDCCCCDEQCEQEAVRLTAKEARAISDRFQERELINDDLADIFDYIREAAVEGKYRVVVELSMNNISYFERITQELERYGFVDLHFKGMNINGEQAAEVTVAW